MGDTPDQVHSGVANIVQTSDERANDVRSSLCRQQGLRGGEAQRYVDADTFLAECAGRHDAVPCQRALHHDVFMDFREFPALFDLTSGETTSAETSPSTMSQISRTCSSIGRPSFAISEGLVVTPSTIPQAAPFFNSSRFAVSRKNFTTLPSRHLQCISAADLY